MASIHWNLQSEDVALYLSKLKVLKLKPATIWPLPYFIPNCLDLIFCFSLCISVVLFAFQCPNPVYQYGKQICLLFFCQFQTGHFGTEAHFVVVICGRLPESCPCLVICGLWGLIRRSHITHVLVNMGGRQMCTWETCQYLAQCVLENKSTSSKLSVVKSYLLSLSRVSMKGAHNHIGTWEGDWDSTGCCRSFPNSFWLLNSLYLQQGKRRGGGVFRGREWSQ